MKNVAALLCVLLLAACGLQPIYSGGSRGAAAATLSSITVAPIPDRAGWLVGNALRLRLGQPSETPRYRLEVALDDAITGFGIRGDNSIARERRTLRARYRLVSVDTGAVLLERTAAADLGIDRVSSDYAVVAAETTALERLSTELASQISGALALYGRSAGPSEGAPAAR